MRDWEQYVRSRLPLAGLTPERSSRIVREVASQLEEFYRDALSRGLVDKEADAYARDQVRDWSSFSREVERADRANAQPKLDRWAEAVGEMPYQKGWGWNVLADFLHDLRFALRQLRKSPGFTAAAVLTFALGIGANTAIFSMVDAVLFRSMPYKDSESIVAIFEHDVQRAALRNPVSPAAFHYWRDRAQSFEVMAAAHPWEPVLAGERPQQVQGLRASATLFRLLGVDPALGRTFRDEESEPGYDRVIVLGHALWQSQFGGDPAITGKQIQLDGVAYVVIGVMPQEFRFPTFWFPEAKFWAPLSFTPAQMRSNSRHLRLFARVKPGITLEQVRAEMATLAGQIKALAPRTYATLAVNVEPVLEATVANVRKALLVLLVAVGLVLLIACANVANLLLVRNTARGRELAVRVAMGAGRARLLRQLLAESLLLAVIGGATGWLLARWVLAALPVLAAGSVPRLEEVALDARVLVFAIGVSTFAALVAGLIPAWLATRVELGESLKETARQTAGARSRLRHALIMGQVVLALTLLTGAGLLLRTVYNLQTFDPGFARFNVLTASISLAGSRHISAEHQNQFLDDLLSRVRALPGVESAGIVNHLPVGGDIWARDFTVEGEPEPATDNLPNAVYRVATPDYLRTIGISILRGRDFSAQDTANAPPVVIVNETLARRFLSDDPLGRRIRFGDAQSSDVWRTVVGVTRDARQWELTRKPRPEFYFPYQQNPSSWNPIVTLALRSGEKTPTLLRAVETQVHEIDPNLPVTGARTMEAILDSGMRPQRLNGVLVALFAILALVLAAVGVYGVVALAVSQRTQEIGLRMALGAQPRNILTMMLGRGLRLVLPGAAMGLAVSLWVARSLRSLLFGVSSSDPLVYASVTMLLVWAALVACWIPARRATRVDPVHALRNE